MATYGELQNQIEDRIIPSTHTTPDSVKINELIAQMHAEGCIYVFMEVIKRQISSFKNKNILHLNFFNTNN